MLDSEIWCHKSHGETFRSVDPQVEGRAALWTRVSDDSAQDDSEQEDFHRRTELAGDYGRLCTVTSPGLLMNNGFAFTAKNVICTEANYSYTCHASKNDCKASLSPLIEVSLAKCLEVPQS